MKEIHESALKFARHPNELVILDHLLFILKRDCITGVLKALRFSFGAVSMLDTRQELIIGLSRLLVLLDIPEISHLKFMYDRFFDLRHLV